MEEKICRRVQKIPKQRFLTKNNGIRKLSFIRNSTAYVTVESGKKLAAEVPTKESSFIKHQPEEGDCCDAWSHAFAMKNSSVKIVKLRP